MTKKEKLGTEAGARRTARGKVKASPNKQTKKMVLPTTKRMSTESCPWLLRRERYLSREGV